MTEQKYLGKKPSQADVNWIEKWKMTYERELIPKETVHYVAGFNSKRIEELTQALLEAADQLEKRCPKRYRKAHTKEDELTCCWCGLAKKLRISAGVEE